MQQIEQAGGSVIEMDMTDSKSSITSKIQSIGHIDILVNNAGYSILAPCEDIRYALDRLFFFCGNRTEPLGIGY